LAWDAERPESALGESVASPLVVSCEIDMLPAERREELEQFGVDSEAAASRSSDRPRQQYGIYREVNGGLGQPRLKRQPDGAFMPTDPIAALAPSDA
jgi:hypothetical protein